MIEIVGVLLIIALGALVGTLVLAAIAGGALMYTVIRKFLED